MTKLLLLSFILISISGFGQTKSYSEKDIYLLFKKSISQRDKKKISIPSNPWLICNKDSSFYLKDTLRIISNSYHNHKLLNCCDYLGWTFYEKDKFISNRLQLCKEPTSASATKDKDHFTLKVLSADNYLLLSIYNNTEFIDSFKIVDINSFKQENIDLTSTVITFLRLK